MSSPPGVKSNRVAASQEFLDTNQYSLKSIYRYERIFGHTWVSTGGEQTTKEFCIRLNLKPGYKVLDIGCGSGGSAFYMARQYGVFVSGIDLSANMISIANDRLRREDKPIQDKVTFEIGDILKVDLSENQYDVIYSRDTILHIRDKEALFRRIRSWLKPGGILFITDYMRGETEASPEFQLYVKNRGYFLTTVTEYDNALKSSGFRTVEAENMSSMFIKVLEDELKYFIPSKEAFVEEFSINDFNEIVNGWRSKIEAVKDGYQTWGLFIANK